MAKEKKSTLKQTRDTKKIVIKKSHKIGDKVKAWQPTKDRTGKPPTGNKEEKND